MKLHVFKRTAARKSEANKLRREGNIPAVVYVKDKPAENVMVKGEEYKTLMRGLQSGRLSTSVFTLVGEDGKTRRAIIKEIQYNITNYNVIHLDFEELNDNSKVKVKVPIECVNQMECEGVKLGGAIRQVIRTIKVSCLPKDIPEVFQIDVKSLGMRDSRRLKDLDIPNTVRPLADLNEVAVVIVKR